MKLFKIFKFKKNKINEERLKEYEEGKDKLFNKVKESGIEKK